MLPGITVLLGIASFLTSFLMITLLFAAIYKILPDRTLTWRNVTVGAVVTALLFTIGKALIGWYIGGSTIATSYGAAGALLVVLLWVYYSAQIFLLGAEFTKAWSGLQGSPEALAAGARPTEATPRPGRPPRRRRWTKPQAGSAVTTARSPLLHLAALGAVVTAALRRCGAAPQAVMRHQHPRSLVAIYVHHQRRWSAPAGWLL